MTDEDRKAFDKFWKEESGWCSEPDLGCSEKLLARDAWLAAIAHERGKAKELVDAVDNFVGVHCGCGDQPYHNKGAKMFVDANDLSNLAAKLKEQP